MASNKKISQLTNAASPASGDAFAIARSGASNKITIDNLMATASPLNLAGSAAVGTSLKSAREDHVHSNSGLLLTGKHTIYIPAAAMRQRFSNGCQPLSAVEISASQPNILTLDFDKDAIEYAQFGVAMPKSWDEGTVSGQFLWSHPSTTTNFNSVWGLQAVAVGNDDAIGASFGTAAEVTDTGGTTNDLYISAETGAITIAGSPAEGDMVFFQAYRNATSGSDTLAVDARLHGIRLFYTVNAGSDA